MPPESGPDPHATPGNVLILSAEDDPARVIKPRFLAAGGDEARLSLLQGFRTPGVEPEGKGDEIGVILDAHATQIRKVIEQHDIKLVVIDPLMAFLGSRIDSHKDQDIRQVLARLKTTAEETGAAIIIVRHLNKLSGGPALYRGGGSIGIIGAARTGLAVARVPYDPDLKALVITKSNVGPIPNFALGFKTEPRDDVSVVGWCGELPMTADDLLCPPKRKAKGQGDETDDSAVDRCCRKLRELLKDGRRPAKEVESLLKESGFSVSTIRRAREAIGIKSDKARGSGGQWMMELPADDSDDPFADAPAFAGEGAQPRRSPPGGMKTLSALDDMSNMKVLPSSNGDGHPTDPDPDFPFGMLDR